jgi:hypothetical protein
MHQFILLLLFSSMISFSNAQSSKPPCSEPAYRQFDFWIGEWDVYGKNGQKGGDSRISLILDSCIILEEWTSANATQGVIYKGKSFNTFNAATGQWQQTWVDNVGGTTEFLRGEAEEGKIIFYADDVRDKQGRKFVRRLTFYKLDYNKVRQHGERSTDEGKTWTTEYDLEYRRKK